MTTAKERTLVEDVIVSGIDDWVYAAWVYQIARRTESTDKVDLRAISIGLIIDVLSRGSMVAGDIVGDRHVPWTGSTMDAIARVIDAWMAWGESPPTPGAIVWLDLTDVGRSIALGVLARESN